MGHHVDGFSVQGTQAVEKSSRWLACADGDITTITLSDGVAACSQSARAADIAVHEAAFFVTEHFHSLITKDEEDVAHSICAHVLDAIKKESVKKDVLLEEFGCTLLVFAYDSPSGQTLLFHLGDGGIIRLNDGQITVLSSPHSGGSPLTDLLISTYVFDKMRVRKETIKESCSVFLLTDGCWLLREKIRSLKQFEGIVRRNTPTNDATCVSMTFIADKDGE